jgi:hypothetical protein
VDSHIDRYQQLRAAQRTLNLSITETLSRRAIEETAKKLGLWKNGRPAVSDERELDLLNDAAVHDYAIAGVSAVARYAARKDLKLTPDEARLLRGMTDAHPTVIAVRETTPDLGAKVHDVLRDEELFLTDLALASSGAADASVVVRLMRVDGIVMTAGPGRAIDDNVGKLLAAVGKLPDSAWTARWRGAIGTNLYRIALADEDGARAVITSMMTHGKDPLSEAVKRTLQKQLSAI